MDKKKYSVIVFDLGNVLIPFDYTIMTKKLDLLEEGLGNKFMDFYKSNYHIHRSLEAGKLDNQAFIDLMLTACNGKLDSLTFCKYYSEIFSENSDVTALLPLLKQKYRLLLLSNTNEIHRQFGYQHYEFLNNFEKLFLSHQIGAVKPEAEIYKAVQDYTGLSASEHIFIDDVAEYARGAINAGWDAIQFVNYEQLLKELKKRNIL